MQQRNVLIFVVLTLLVWVGWQQLTLRLYPPPKKSVAKKTDALPFPAARELWIWNDVPEPAQVARLVAASLPGPGLESALPITIAVAQTVGLNVPPAAVAAAKLVEVEAPEPPPAPEKTQQVVLGDDAFHLKVVLTNLGA